MSERQAYQRQIIEIIPNYSEGRNEEVMKAILAPFDREGIMLCRLEMDASYHRSVVTVIGELQAVCDAAVESVRIASERIDLRHHQGEHKRMGACDVMPLLPIANISVEELIAVSEQLGDRIAKETHVPVYLYALSAKREHCVSLPDIRKDEFEGFSEKIKDDKWKPDFGDAMIHPAAGVVAVGVRKPLIAFNIDLDSKDEIVPKKISQAIRFSSGGYRFIQAGQAYVKERDVWQVSMNVTDYEKTALYRAYEAVKMEARRYDAAITGSEIIGLIPKDCLLDTLSYYLKQEKHVLAAMPLAEVVKHANHFLRLHDFDETKVIEYYVETHSV